MKKFRKAFSVVLSLAMVVSSFNLNVRTTFAGVDDINTDSNLALGKNVTSLHMHSDGDGTTADKVTDGSLTTVHYVINAENDNWGGAGGETYVTVDLGDYYDASTLDEVIVAYKNNNANDTVVGRSYSILYSTDGVDFNTAVEEKNVGENDLGDKNETVDNVAGTTGTVRFVRIYYPTTADWGIQLKEVAVIAANPQKAEVEKPDAPTFAATSTTNGVIDYTISDLAEGATANVYLNEKLYATGLVNGTYKIENLTKGSYTLCAESVKAGITSDRTEDVTVNVDGELPIEEKLVSTDYNIAIGKSAEVSVRVNEGTLAGLNDANFSTVCAVSGAQTGWGHNLESYAVIDLGATYDASTIESIVVDYHTAVTPAEITPFGKAYTISYSSDSSTFTEVAGQENTVFVDDSSRRTIDDVSSQTGKVRYVKVTWPKTAQYGIQVRELGVIAPNAKEVEVEKCADPAGVTVSSDKAGTISYTIEAGENQEDYKYKAVLDNGTVLGKDLSAGTKYTAKVSAGKHTVTIISTYSGMVSDGITSEEVEVADPDEINAGIIAGTKNIALKANNTEASVVSVSSFYDGHDIESAQVALNGALPTGEANTDVLRTAAGQAASVVIDLGASYAKAQFKDVLVGFVNPRTYAGTIKVSASETNEEDKYEQIGELTGYQAQKDPGVSIADVELDVSAYTQIGIRYIKLDLSAGANGWGYCVNEIGTILSVDASDATYATSKTMVEVPQLASKPYTGSTIVADIPESELYTATVNNGGTDAGTYNVTLTLADPDNYYWEGDKRAKDADKTVTFEITKADNEWTSELAINDWTYGADSNDPSAAAKFGDVTFTYSDDAEGTFTETVPTGAGKHYVKASVADTTNYAGLSKVVEFNIDRANQDAPSADSFTVVDSTLDTNADGSISGLEGYEFRAEADTEYTTVDGGVAEGLLAGNYYVRAKATDNYNASDDTLVTVGTGRKLSVTYSQTEGVEIVPESDEKEFAYGTEVKFTIKIKDGYEKTAQFAVNATGATLTSEGDVYTIASLEKDTVISVDGVSLIPETTTVAPTVKPTVKPTQANVKKPGKTKVKTASKKKSANKIKISLKKIKAAGYQVAVFKSKKSKKAIFRKYTTKVKATLKSKKFKGKKKLFVKVRAYNLNNKTKVFGAWSSAKKVKIK